MAELASVPGPEGTDQIDEDVVSDANGAVVATIPILAFYHFLLGLLGAAWGEDTPAFAPLVLGTVYCLVLCGLWIASQSGTESRLPFVQLGLAVTWSSCMVWILVLPAVAPAALLAAAVVSVCIMEKSELAAAAAWAVLTGVVACFSSLPLTGAAVVCLAATGSVGLAAGIRSSRIRSAQRRAAGQSIEGTGAERMHDSAASLQQAGAVSRVLETRGEMDGLWEWDLKSDRLYFSPRWRELLDYGDEAFSGVPADWFNLVHPYDLEELMSRLRAHIEGESDRFECEHRIRQADGSYRWVLSHGRIVFDDAGIPERLAGSQVDMKRLKSYEAQLIHQATHDRLTGLPNRERLREILHEECTRIQNGHAPMLVVAFLDLDDFKQINDTLGHKVGDDLLQGVAQRLFEAVGSQHVVARLGGDEFVIVLRTLHDERDAVEIVQRAATALREPFQLGTEDLSLSISVGVALSRDRDVNPDEVLCNADIAMYHAKRQGKGRVELFNDEMGLKASRHFELQARLRRAFENRRFELFYQPIVNASDGRIVCAEALMRWRTTSNEIVLPGEFIPMVEEMDLIHDLGRWALEDACRQAVAWQEAGLPEIEVSVNVSAKQLARLDLADAVKSILAETGLDPRLLQLEITESDLVESRYSAPEVLDRFALLGVKTAIDDFGTGYSSLSYLRSLRCDVLKIDRSFVSEVASDSTKSAAITRSIIGLARNLELGVVAEGVETQPQIDFLRAAGCQRLQGYFAGRPMPAAQLAEIMRKGGRLPLRGPESVAPLPARSDSREALSKVSA